MATQLVFNNTPLSVITLNNQIWIASSELAKILNYADNRAVTKIYDRNSDEFTGAMTSVVKLTTNGINNSLREKSVRLFSLRGAHLIAMFANTEIARDFRKWVLDILDKEVQKTTPQPATLPAPAPVEPTEAKIETVKFYDQEILTQKIHEISNQFHFSRTANNAIWFAIRYVTGTPSPNDFDVRHLPLIISECNRINAILTKYTDATKQHERLIIGHVIRKRESIDDVLDAAEHEIKSITNLTDNELLKSVKPCYNLTTIDVVGQK